MLQQTLLGYISAGWPREDIVIIDNSGTMDANSHRALSAENPFFLDYHLFRQRYGVSILQTPALLNFSQLQNFLLFTAMNHEWTYYFWGDMDVGILGREEEEPYVPLYHRVLDIIVEAGISEGDNSTAWAIKLFAFDRLALINVESWRSIGQWDAFIPYYKSDCDAYSRLRMKGYSMDNVDDVGHIFDVAEPVKDPETQFFPPAATTASSGYLIRTYHEYFSQYDETEEAQLNSPRFATLKSTFENFERSKMSSSVGRNTWQNIQKGGKRERWTPDPAGFQVSWWRMNNAGKSIFAKKWGTKKCDLIKQGKDLSDPWKDVVETTA